MTLPSTNAVPAGPANANAGAPPAEPPKPSSPPGTPPLSGNSNPPTPPAPTFSQADVDRIIGERLVREQAKYSDYDTLKERAEQWEKFQKESRPEQEKALDAARSEAAEQVRKEMGGSLVQAYVKAAAATRMTEAQITTLLENVDPTRFLTPTGAPDEAKIKTFIDGIAPAVDPKQVPGGFGQGYRDSALAPSLQSGAAEWERRNTNGAVPPLFT